MSEMGSRNGFCMQICLYALLFLASSSAVCARYSTVTARTTELDHFRDGADRAGSRVLLQSTTVNQCQYDFSKVDFSSVTSVCKAPGYDATSCCNAFTKLACQYTPQINDFDSLCPIYFLSYLNIAGSYPEGIFIGQGRCNDGNALCPS